MREGRNLKKSECMYHRELVVIMNNECLLMIILCTEVEDGR